MYRITFTRAKDLATKFKIVDILYPLFVEDPSVFLSVPPPPPSSSSAGTIHVSGPHSGSLPIMLPPSTNPSTAKYTTNYGSFNMQPWEKQPYQSLPSITNQQQDQSTFSLLLFICLHCPKHHFLHSVDSISKPD